MEIFTKNPTQTKKLGEKLAKEILSGKIKTRVLALVGELGGGKTTFLQGLGKGLKIKEKILSPTFILMRVFQISTPKFQKFYHFDCYRIKTEREILKLGFKKIIKEPKNLIAIEWAEKIKRILPKNTLWIKFKIRGKKEREIEILKGRKVLKHYE